MVLQEEIVHLHAHHLTSPYTPPVLVCVPRACCIALSSRSPAQVSSPSPSQSLRFTTTEPQKDILVGSVCASAVVKTMAALYILRYRHLHWDVSGRQPLCAFTTNPEDNRTVSLLQKKKKTHRDKGVCLRLGGMDALCPLHHAPPSHIPQYSRLEREAGLEFSALSKFPIRGTPPFIGKVGRAGLYNMCILSYPCTAFSQETEGDSRAAGGE